MPPPTHASSRSQTLFCLGVSKLTKHATPINKRRRRPQSLEHHNTEIPCRHRPYCISLITQRVVAGNDEVLLHMIPILHGCKE